MNLEEARAAQPPVPEWQRRRDEALQLRSDAGRARAEERVAAALHHARAALRGVRWLAGDALEVRFDLDGERFVSLVDGRSLNVVDAGICLAGHDGELTLESLPGVIREAMDAHELHVTAW